MGTDRKEKIIWILKLPHVSLKVHVPDHSLKWNQILSLQYSLNHQIILKCSISILSFFSGFSWENTMKIPFHSIIVYNLTVLKWGINFSNISLNKDLMGY